MKTEKVILQPNTLLSCSYLVVSPPKHCSSIGEMGDHRLVGVGPGRAGMQCDHPLSPCCCSSSPAPWRSAQFPRPSCKREPPDATA